MPLSFPPWSREARGQAAPGSIRLRGSRVLEGHEANYSSASPLHREAEVLRERCAPDLLVDVRLGVARQIGILVAEEPAEMLRHAQRPHALAHLEDGAVRCFREFDDLALFPDG